MSVHCLDDLAWWTSLLMNAIIDSKVCNIMDSVLADSEKAQFCVIMMCKLMQFQCKLMQFR